MQARLIGNIVFWVTVAVLFFFALISGRHL
jgi:hypothetical protein